MNTKPIDERKTTPLNNAYPEANSLDGVVVMGFTGPIPVRIIEAFKTASIQERDRKSVV